MEVTGIALQGLHLAAELANTSARRVSQAGAGAAAAGDVVDLSAEMVALMQAKSLNSALVSVVRTADEMDSHVLNLLG